MAKIIEMAKYGKLKFKIIILIGFVITGLQILSCSKTGNTDIATNKNAIASLGKKLFFDESLSNPIGQSCASCHAPGTAFTDALHNIVSPGITAGLFGNRNAPTVSYAMYVPQFQYSPDDSSYIGGLFLDGRVNTLEEQAQKPFLNPLEMGNVDAAMVVSKLRNSSSYIYYKLIYGDANDVNTAFANMATALATFERTEDVNSFTSKFDYYLKGQATLSASELNGMHLFSDSTKAMCGNCHLITPDPASNKILFTDFSYVNDGVPKNPYNPFYTIPINFNPAGQNYIDFGLGAIINDSAFYGTFRTPTLRNVALTPPYFHNGCFGTLEQVVHFYNTRDTAGSGFPPSEYVPTIDSAETGNQHLTPQEEADIVAFLKTLTDGYQP